MIDGQSGVIALLALGNIFGILLLVMWLLPTYHLDRFRERLFEIRDELFDLAANGDVPFNHPAYGLLRLVINGHIRFAHEANMWWVPVWLAMRHEIPQRALLLQSNWEKALETLPEEGKKKLLGIQHQVHGEVISNAVTLRTLYLLVLIATYVQSVVSRLGPNVEHANAETRLQAKMLSVNYRLDSAALEVAEEEEIEMAQMAGASA